MATNYTVSLTDAEKKAMEYITVSVQDWIDNVVAVRVARATNEIYNMEVARMTDDPNIATIPADKAQVVLDANIKSAATRESEKQPSPT